MLILRRSDRIITASALLIWLKTHGSCEVAEFSHSYVRIDATLGDSYKIVLHVYTLIESDHVPQ